MNSVDKKKVGEVLDILEATYPDAHCALNHRSPLELLIATILSAQCTDVRVNTVTPSLFRSFPDAAAFAAASPDKLEALIRSTGFFRNKAKNIIACARVLVEAHDGEVPKTLGDLVALPGVGRKTANVVLGNAFDIPGLVVDTHVKRISRRLGWTKQGDPERIEQDLCRLMPPQRWVQAGHVLIFHGRALCKAPTPVCSACPVQAHCPRIGVDRCK